MPIKIKIYRQISLHSWLDKLQKFNTNCWMFNNVSQWMRCGDFSNEYLKIQIKSHWIDWLIDTIEILIFFKMLNLMLILLCDSMWRFRLHLNISIVKRKDAGIEWILPVLFCSFSTDCVIDVANLIRGCDLVDVTLYAVCWHLDLLCVQVQDLIKSHVIKMFFNHMSSGKKNC